MAKVIVLASCMFGAIVSVASAAQAPVANLADILGKVLVDHGKGFAIASQETLQAGDRVFIGEKSSATVAFTGCTVKLDKPIVFIVGKSGPCVNGTKTASAGGPKVDPPDELPSGAGAAGASAADVDSSVLAPLAILGGGAVIGGSIYFITKNNIRRISAP